MMPKGVKGSVFVSVCSGRRICHHTASSSDCKISSLFRCGTLTGTV